MIRRPPRSTHCISSAASDVYKRQEYRLTDEVLVAALVYVRRLQERTRVRVTRYEIHRLIATVLMVSVKYNCDNYYSNKYYALSAGLSLIEINTLEREMLELLNYELEVTVEKYEEFANYLKDNT
eukprot:TRINITY_DN13009_c0_g1_i5.p1 TRINITY_DN13009_c0_g1~~TRINITY_DN13009_c0_g1_i5.p1  ORF type:complete len:132 (+),score=37.88 TRINITY_DN13009_c0_g1_i5:24-398(+)